jgi:hypothetical protein
VSDSEMEGSDSVEEIKPDGEKVLAGLPATPFPFTERPLRAGALPRAQEGGVISTQMKAILVRWRP